MAHTASDDLEEGLALTDVVAARVTYLDKDLALLRFRHVDIFDDQRRPCLLEDSCLARLGDRHYVRCGYCSIGMLDTADMEQMQDVMDYSALMNIFSMIGCAGREHPELLGTSVPGHEGSAKTFHLTASIYSNTGSIEG